MGMLIRRHRDRHTEDANPAPRKRRGRAPKQVEPPKAPDAEATKTPGTEPDPGSGGELVKASTEASPYAELTDDEVLEAYSTNVPEGEATDRAAMQAELEALDAEDEGDTGE